MRTREIVSIKRLQDKYGYVVVVNHKYTPGFLARLIGKQSTCEQITYAGHHAFYDMQNGQRAEYNLEGWIGESICGWVMTEEYKKHRNE